MVSYQQVFDHFTGAVSTDWIKKNDGSDNNIFVPLTGPTKGDGVNIETAHYYEWLANGNTPLPPEES